MQTSLISLKSCLPWGTDFTLMLTSRYKIDNILDIILHTFIRSCLLSPSWQIHILEEINLPGIYECKHFPVTDKVSELCHGYHSCTFKADPFDLKAAPCQSFHLTLKTTYACVDKSVFHAKFVDRVMTTADLSTTTLMYKPTTKTVMNSEFDNFSRTPEYSTSLLNI